MPLVSMQVLCAELMLVLFQGVKCFKAPYNSKRLFQLLKPWCGILDSTIPSELILKKKVPWIH